MLCPEELAAVTAAAAIALSKGRTLEEVEVLAAVFVQIGDTLATIAVQKGIYEARCCNNSRGAGSPNLPLIAETASR